MNRNSLRTLLCITVLSVLLTAIGFGASAQETLPLPQVAGAQIEGRVSATPDQTAPDNMAEMRVDTSFQWLDTGAIKYKLTFVEVATGIKHVQTVPASKCSGVVCIYTFGASPFFDTLTDEMELTWRVTAFMPDGKLFSGTRTVIVNEVVQPTLVGPDNGASLSYLGELSWTNANAINDYFRVVMVDPATGKKVLNQFFDAQACAATCAIRPRYFTDKLVIGKTYNWYVVAVGETGETRKSDVRTVVISA